MSEKSRGSSESGGDQGAARVIETLEQHQEAALPGPEWEAHKNTGLPMVMKSEQSLLQ